MVVLRRDRDRPNATNWLLQALAVVDTAYLLASVLIQPLKTVNDIGDPKGLREKIRRVFPYVEPHACTALQLTDYRYLFYQLLLSS